MVHGSGRVANRSRAARLRVSVGVDLDVQEPFEGAVIDMPSVRAVSSTRGNASAASLSFR